MARRVLAAGFALAAATTLAACGEDEAEAERDGASDEITSAGTQDAFALKVGDCFDEPDGTEFEDVAAVPCAETHEAEIYHQFDLEDGDFPGQDAIDNEAIEECGPAFEDFAQIAYDDSLLDWYPLTPTQGSWDGLDDRTVQCVIYDTEGPVEGTLEGAAR